MCYGYRVAKRLDAGGEPIRGEREIVAEEAEIIRRLFRDYCEKAKACASTDFPGLSVSVYARARPAYPSLKATAIPNDGLPSEAHGCPARANVTSPRRGEVEFRAQRGIRVRGNNEANE
ncbi:MAG TPA: hypothetical protein VFY53_06715 [Rhodoplanes sp.]|nr:hypothetical protein [Rhodoplanes sp.]